MDQLLQALPEPLKSFVAGEVNSGKYINSEAYLVELIAADRKKRLIEKLESLVEEAEDSGEATPWTPADRDFIRQEVASRIAKRQTTKS